MYDSTIHHERVVAAAKTTVGDEPAGPARAYHILVETVRQLNRLGEDAGLLYKPVGQNYAERSIDVIMYRTAGGQDGTTPITKPGATFDALGNAEGTATPQWARTTPTGYGNPADWRPVDPTPPDPPEPPTDYATRAQVEALSAQVAALTARVEAMSGLMRGGTWPVRTNGPFGLSMVGTVGPQTPTP